MQGSGQAYRELVQQHAAALTLFARQWCRHPEDAVQEALIELFRQPQSPRDAVAWLYAAVRHKAMKQTRAETRRAKYHQLAAEAGRVESWFEASPSAGLEADEVESALEQLDESQREVVVARVWGNLSFQQIAAVTGTSSSSTHRLFQQALGQLRRHLDADPSHSSTTGVSPSERPTGPVTKGESR